MARLQLPPQEGPPPAGSMPPVVDLGIPGYESAEEIGRGGFATVYRARRQRFGDWVAVKVIDTVPDERSLRRFERELEAMGKVAGHRNLVAVYDAGQRDDGRPYIVMELVPGGTLADRLRREGPLPWPEVVQIGVVLAAVLQWAHERGVIHRDVKPENVLVDDRFADTRDRIRLSDFGVATIQGRTATRSEIWTLAHAAPEMVLHGASPSARTDLYALASTLYRLLDGDAPFVRADDEAVATVFARMQQGTLRDLRARGVPDPLATVIEQGLDTDPERRPPTMAAFGSMLGETADGMGAAVHAPPPLPDGAGERSTVEDPSTSLTEELAATDDPPDESPPDRVPDRSVRQRATSLLTRPKGFILLAAVAMLAALAVTAFVSKGEEASPPTPSTTRVSTTSSTTSTTSTTLTPGSVFSDDFAQDRGWAQSDSSISRRARVDDQFVIVAKLSRNISTLTAPRLSGAETGTRTKVEADVLLMSEGASGLAGVTCRHSGSNYYFGQVGVDGYWRIGRTGLVTLLRSSQSPDTFVKGLEYGQPIRVGMECDSGGGQRPNVTIRLFVNGRQVGSATDSNGFVPAGAGLVLNPDTPGEWRFDNFSVARF
ncbi:MAG: serine/threonine-protein kinase [Acidimicrobiales bacterium]